MNIHQPESEAEIPLSFKIPEKLLTFCTDLSSDVSKYLNVRERESYNSRQAHLHFKSAKIINSIMSGESKNQCQTKVKQN